MIPNYKSKSLSICSLSHAHDFSELRNHHFKGMSTMITQFTYLNSLYTPILITISILISN
jgi:hypothetical protein